MLEETYCMINNVANCIMHPVGTLPAMSARFNHYMLLDEGTNVNLTTEITSDLPLSNGSVSWKVSTGPNLPKNAEVINYTAEGRMYSSLILHDLSYYDDTGNYTCTVSNDCGMSFVFVYIDITKGMLYCPACHQLAAIMINIFVLVDIKCNDSGKIIKPLQNVVTVAEQFIQLKCLVQGNLRTLGYSITSYWVVEFPPPSQRDPIYITDNSTDPYHIYFYPTCETCCNFTSQLTILSVPAELDGATVSCVEHLEEIDPVTRQSTATLSKYMKDE